MTASSANEPAANGRYNPIGRGGVVGDGVIEGGSVRGLDTVREPATAPSLLREYAMIVP